MADYWFCVRHHRVEEPPDLCPPIDRLGPYATADDAARALDKVADRNAEWEAEDARWEGREPGSSGEA